jgi:hypothetical protein
MWKRLISLEKAVSEDLGIERVYSKEDYEASPELQEQLRVRARIKKNNELRNKLNPSEYFGTGVAPETDDTLPDKESIKAEGYTGY